MTEDKNSRACPAHGIGDFCSSPHQAASVDAGPHLDRHNFIAGARAWQFMSIIAEFGGTKNLRPA